MGWTPPGGGTGFVSAPVQDGPEQVPGPGTTTNSVPTNRGFGKVHEVIVPSHLTRVPTAEDAPSYV